MIHVGDGDNRLIADVLHRRDLGLGLEAGHESMCDARHELSGVDQSDEISLRTGEAHQLGGTAFAVAHTLWNVPRMRTRYELAHHDEAGHTRAEKHDRAYINAYEVADDVLEDAAIDLEGLCAVQRGVCGRLTTAVPVLCVPIPLNGDVGRRWGGKRCDARE